MFSKSMKKDLNQWQFSEAVRKSFVRAIDLSFYVLKEESISIWRDIKYSVYFDRNNQTEAKVSQRPIFYAEHMQLMEPPELELVRVCNKVKHYQVLSKQELTVISHQVREYKNKSFLGKVWWRLFNDVPIDVYIHLAEIAALHEVKEIAEIDAVAGIEAYNQSGFSEEVSFWDRLTRSWRANLEDACSDAISNVMQQSKQIPECRFVVSDASCIEISDAMLEQSTRDPFELPEQIDKLSKMLSDSMNRHRKMKTRSLGEHSIIYSNLLELTRRWLEYVLWERGYTELIKEKEKSIEQINIVHKDLFKIYHPDKNNNNDSMSNALNEKKKCFESAIEDVLQQTNCPEWLSDLKDRSYERGMNEIEKLNEKFKQDVQALGKQVQEIEVRCNRLCEEVSFNPAIEVQFQQKELDSRLQQKIEARFQQEREMQEVILQQAFKKQEAKLQQTHEENNKKFNQLFAFFESQQENVISSSSTHNFFVNRKKS